MCACVRERASERAQTSRNRVWVLAKLRDDSLKQKQNNITLSADGIFPNTLIKNQRKEKKGGGETEREQGREREMGGGRANQRRPGI